MAPVRAELFNDGPEAWAVVHFPDMGQFVGNDIINDRQRHQDQPPVQGNVASMIATAPARAGRGQAEHRHGNAE